MRYLVFMFFILLSLRLSAQKWEIQTGLLFVPQDKELPGNSWEGTSLSVNYAFLNSADFLLTGGLEFQGNSWANHLLLRLGAFYTMIKKKNWNADLQVSAGNGLAMFAPDPMYSFNTQAGVFINRKTKRNNQWGIGTGIQYLTTPAYNTISPLYQMWTIPVQVRYRF